MTEQSPVTPPEPSAAQGRHLPFIHPVRVYWEDTDAGGIVYHSNYVNFMERSRTEWLRAAGFSQGRLREQFAGIFVVTHVSLRYLAPARLDDWLHVGCEVAALGRSSLTLVQNIYRIEQALPEEKPVSQPAKTLLCEGQVRIGWVNSESLRPGRIPESVLKQIS